MLDDTWGRQFVERLWWRTARIKDKAEKQPQNRQDPGNSWGLTTKKSLGLIAIKMKEFRPLLPPIPLISHNCARGARSQRRGAGQHVAPGRQDT